MSGIPREVQATIEDLPFQGNDLFNSSMDEVLLSPNRFESNFHSLGCMSQLLSVHSTTTASVFIQIQAPAAVPTTFLRATEEAPILPPVVLFNHLLDSLTAGARAQQSILMGQLRVQLDHL